MRSGVCLSAETVKRIFDSVACSGPLTRRELCDSLSLSKPAVCRASEILEEAGAVVSIKVDPVYPGRPAELLAPSRDVLLGVLDLSGEAPTFDIFDLRLKYVAKYRMRAPKLETYRRRLDDFLADRVSALKGAFPDSYFGAVSVLTGCGEDGEPHAGPPIQGLYGDRITDAVGNRLNVRTVVSRTYAAASIRLLLEDAGALSGLSLCCHAGADDVFCVLFRDGEPVRGTGTPRPILSARGTSLSRVLSVCSTARELCREIARPLLNALLMTGADNLLLDADIYTYGADLTTTMKKALTEDLGFPADGLPGVYARRHVRKDVLTAAATDARDAYIRGLIGREMRMNSR